MKLGTKTEARQARTIHRFALKAFDEFGLTASSNVGPDLDSPAAKRWRGMLDNVIYAVEDWVMLGRGCSRAAWLSPTSGVVYKVDGSSKTYPWSANENEWQDYLAKWSRANFPLGIRVPKMYLHDVDGSKILAVEMVKGEPYWDEHGDRELNRFCEDNGMYDVHPWNVLVEADGTRVIIDL